jgi:hypothetical protein
MSGLLESIEDTPLGANWNTWVGAAARMQPGQAGMTGLQRRLSCELLGWSFRRHGGPTSAPECQPFLISL